MSTLKTLVFWLLIVISSMLLWQIVRTNSGGQPRTEIDYSTFMSQAEAGQIASVTITGTQIDGLYRNGAGWFRLTGPINPGVYLGLLQEKGVQIRFHDVEKQNVPLQLLGTWAPLILLGALWFFMIRRVRLRNRSNPLERSIPQGTIDPRTGEMR